MKEIVLISGKGGTGKTSMSASFAHLASMEGKAVMADCDVDAADMHLILKPLYIETKPFISGNIAVIDRDKCVQCGRCANLCRFDAISVSDDGKYSVKDPGCEGCGVCVHFCPADAIDFPERDCGEQYISDTRFGTLVHARLHPGAENSGKLVTEVRRAAAMAAREQSADWIIVDGSPGTGCPVIASITNADAVLVVAEPTISGRHDLDRVVELTKHFRIPCYVCINKWDINPEISSAIMSEYSDVFTGKIPYSPDFTKAMISEKAVTEYTESELHKDIKEVWTKLCHKVNNRE